MTHRWPSRSAWTRWIATVRVPLPRRKLKCPSLILRAKPHAWNARGNPAAMTQATRNEHRCLPVRGAMYADAQWSTDNMAEWVCGKSSPQRRETFVQYALAGLRAVLLPDATSEAILGKAEVDDRVKVLHQGTWRVGAKPHAADCEMRTP